MKQICDVFSNFDCSAAWSLLQVLNLFDYETVLMALRSHLTVLLIVYARFGAPPLIKCLRIFGQKGQRIKQLGTRLYRKQFLRNMNPTYSKYVLSPP